MSQSTMATFRTYRHRNKAHGIQLIKEGVQKRVLQATIADLGGVRFQCVQSTNGNRVEYAEPARRVALGVHQQAGYARVMA